MEKHNSTEYPYGEFPIKFTKLGQEKYFQELNKKHEQPVTTTTITPQPNTQQGSQQANFDISKFIPMIKLMSNKKSMSSTDMLQMFLPLLGGSNMGNITELMSLLNNKSQNDELVEDIEISNTTKIDDYIRVE